MMKRMSQMQVWSTGVTLGTIIVNGNISNTIL
jgi:hypothetical protein